MTDTAEPLKLSRDQLRTLMVASERRNRESRDGSPAPTASYPVCAVCDAAVDSQTVTLGLADVGERILTVGPCGHRMSYNLRAADQMVARVQKIVDREEEKPVSVWGTIFSLEDDPPYMYQGSHILPSEADSRDGCVQLAEVPSHITRDGRDDQPEDGAPWPWLRLSVGREDVVLHRRQVQEAYESMGAWLEQTKPEGER